MWVVHRTLDQLAELPAGKHPAPHPDRSIVVPAMADYIRFTGKQIAMPTVWSDGKQEYLRDGSQLLRALRLAGHTEEVFCLWLSDLSLSPASGGETFSPFWEQRTGSDARLLTFDSSPDATQRGVLLDAWESPSQAVGESSWGWKEQEAASLPDWLSWLRAVAKLLPRLPRVAAVNGRRAVFPPNG